MEIALDRTQEQPSLLIPSDLLKQVGVCHRASVEVRAGAIEIRPANQAHPRSGWEHQAQQLALHGEAELLWPEFSNHSDEDWVW